MDSMFLDFAKLKKFAKKITFYLFFAFGIFLIILFLILCLIYRDIFYFSLSAAVFSILMSFLYKNKKYWLPRTRAVLINVGGLDYLRLETNKCNCEAINLTDKYYVVEFGKREKRRDGITLRVVIDDKEIDGDVKVFLNGDGFYISGNVSIFPRTFPDNRSDRDFVYNKNKPKPKPRDKNKTRDNMSLSTHDLVCIKNKQNVTIAAFVVLLNYDIDKIYNGKDNNIDNGEIRKVIGKVYY